MGKQMPGKSGIRGTSLTYLENQLIAKDTCILKFTAALFTIPKTRKQPKCPSTDEWIKKISYICMYIYTHTHTRDYYSAMKKNEIRPSAATWMDLDVIILSEVSQRKTNII